MQKLIYAGVRAGMAIASAATIVGAVGAQTVPSPYCHVPYLTWFDPITQTQPNMLPLNTTFWVGPNLSAAATQYPGIAAAVQAALDQWNATEAAGRLTGWNGMTSASDCPTGQPLQIGLYDFAVPASCPDLSTQNVPPTTVAFVSYFVNPINALQGISSRSISLNSNRAWSLNPLPNQFDLQAAMTHEFGHVLGLTHIENGFCRDDLPSPTCTSSPQKETMSHLIHPTDTCQRTLAPNDSATANWAY